MVRTLSNSLVFRLAMLLNPEQKEREPFHVRTDGRYEEMLS